MIEFAGQSIKEYLRSDSLMLLANIFETYEGNIPKDSTIRNRVSYQCRLLSKKETFTFYIQLIKITISFLKIKSQIQIYISCLDTTEDAKCPYTIRFFNFDYYENVNPVAGSQTSIKTYEDEKLISKNIALLYFMPEIIIHSNDKPLKIDALSSWLADENRPVDDLKIWLSAHKSGMTFDPSSIQTQYLFLHRHNFKFARWQPNGTLIETILFSSSIDFLTKNKNNPEIQSILASNKLEFDEKKLPKDLRHAHRRDEIHRYIAYFRSRLSGPKKLIFWLTGDYFKIAIPLLCALALYIIHIMFQNCTFFAETFPIYQIFNFSYLQHKGFWKTISITIANIIRWIVEAGLATAFLQLVRLLKKFWAWASRKIFSLLILYKKEEP